MKKRWIVLIVALGMLLSAAYPASSAYRLSGEQTDPDPDGEYVVSCGYSFQIHTDCKELSVRSEDCPAGTLVAFVFYSEAGQLVKCTLSVWAEGKTLTLGRSALAKAASCKAVCLSSAGFSPLSGQKASETELRFPHQYSEDVRKPASCKEAGELVHTCEICGDCYVTEIPLAEHTVVIDEASAPDCYHEGCTAGSHCSVCGAVLVAQETLPVCHDFEAASCSLPETCRTCGTTRGSALGHKLVDGVCSRCDYRPIQTVSLNARTLALYRNNSFSLTATTAPEQAPSDEITWRSDDPAVASVDNSGTVTALSAGNAKITASAGGRSASCNVTVKRVMAAVNPLTESDSQTSGSFAVPSAASSLTLCAGENFAFEQAGVFDEYVSAGGKTLTVREAQVDDLIGLSAQQKAQYRNILTELTAVDGDTMVEKSRTGSILGSNYCTILDSNGSFRLMKRMYSGSHCTVWKCSSDMPLASALNDPSSVQITSSIAKQIGNAFDSYYDAIVSDFGTWYDADGDGKLAIFCYDIDNDYQSMSVSSYVAGFFRPNDLADSDGRINGIASDEFGSLLMHKDCIHLDTYPLMGYETPLSDCANAFSVLVHECQHLVNFSYRVSGGPSGYYPDEMDCYLDEAFSMAAEHMICGAASVSSRITYFNSSRYVPGSSLTYWPGYSGTLSQYSNSYLFGQYLRTRYAQLTGTDGNTLFKLVLQRRQANKGGDTLSMIASLLGTSPSQLYVDFWNAIYLKEAKGVNGFRGETWANAIQPHIASSFSDINDGIYNGGCKYYETSQNTDITTDKSNLVITLH